MVQVPEVADIMGRPLGEADLEGQTLVGKTVRGHERLASAVLRVPVDGPAPHRTRRRRQRFVGEIDDLVVGVERDVVVHLVDDFDGVVGRSEEHTSELQSRGHLVCRLLLEKKKKKEYKIYIMCIVIKSIYCMNNQLQYVELS